jgi:hypothetical protein
MRDARGADHLAPAARLVGHIARESGLVHGDALGALRGQALLHVGVLQRLAERLHELLFHIARQPGRGEQAGVHGHVHALDALLA